MRPGGGKAKGGSYEHKVASMLAKALGVSDSDVYRTKNSGAGPKQKGDLQLSSVAAKKFPFTIECKHTKRFDLQHLYVAFAEMKSSWLFKKWWLQLLDECKISGKPGILIWRANHCPDMCALRVADLDYLRHVHRTFIPHTVVIAKEPIWVFRLEDLFNILKESEPNVTKVRSKSDVRGKRNIN